jgi:UDP-glucose 4-epimerase
VLVTGASGFIGSRLARRLGERHETIAVCRGEPPPASPSLRWVCMDLSRPLDRAKLPERLDAIVHLAQSRRYRDFPAGAMDVFAVNVGATQALLDLAVTAGARRFVLASTGGLYPFAKEPIREEVPPAPRNFYFLSKHLSEQLVDAYRGLLEPVVLRLFFVYGAGQTGMLIPKLRDRVVAGQEIPIEGKPALRINPIHVEDAVRAFEAALRPQSPTIVNIAGGESLRVDELVRRIAAQLRREVRITHRESARVGDLVGDIGRMVTELGVTPRISLDDGLGEVMPGGREGYERTGQRR